MSNAVRFHAPGRHTATPVRRLSRDSLRNDAEPGPGVGSAPCLRVPRKDVPLLELDRLAGIERGLLSAPVNEGKNLPGMLTITRRGDTVDLC